MASGKWQMWEEDPAQLERITNWAANGLTDEEIARSMGVRRETLWVWKRDHPNISNAIKSGRLMACEAVENALFRKATGAVVIEDTVEEYRGELRDGKPSNGTVMRRTTKRKLPPDTAAIIFYLKNRMPERYTDTRKTEVAVTAPTISLGVEPGRADD